MKKNLALLLAVLMVLTIGVPALLVVSPQREAKAAPLPIGTWVKDADGGFGDAANIGAFPIVEYEGALYAGVTDATNGCEVFKKTATGWESVSPLGLGNAKNMAIVRMAVYDGKLYAGTANIDTAGIMSGAISQGCELYAYDGTTWTQVVGTEGMGNTSGGFGSTNNLAVTSMAVFDNKLYIGVANLEVDATLGELSISMSISSSGGSVYSYDSVAGTVEQVAGSEGGFGNVENIAVSALESFGGKLYAGTANLSISEIVIDIATGVSNSIELTTEGCELYSYDGSDWAEVATEGITDDKNLAINTMCEYGEKLLIGTANLEIDDIVLEVDILNFISGDLFAFDVQSTDYSTNGFYIYSYDGDEMSTMVGGGFSDDKKELAVFTLEPVTIDEKEFLLASVEANYDCSGRFWGPARLMTYDGEHWYMGADDGFGNKNNTMVMGMCSLGDLVFVGGTVNNVQGCEVWFGLPPLIPPAVVTGINPDSGVRGTEISATITGERFVDGARVALRKDEVDIDAEREAVGSPTEITCKIPIPADATVGKWDVVVQNPNCEEGILPEGFEVKYPIPVITSISPTSGIIGSTLTINGTNFGATQGTSYVQFGAKKATEHSSWSDTQIKVKVPSGISGSVDVKVVTIGGTSNAKKFTVTYPAPTITSITPSSATNDGVVNVTITGTGFRTGATVALVGSGGMINGTNVKVVSSTKITASFDLRGLMAGSYTLEVTNTDKKSAEKKDAFTVEEAVTPPPPAATGYLAEGSTDWGYSAYITVVNPNYEPVSIKVTYQTRDGEKEGGTFPMAPMSQATINPTEKIGATDFSTKVECLEGKPIAVDRTMTWVGPGAASEEAHNSVGVTSPSTTWYLPEGSSAWGFECWLLIQNPNDTEAVCNVTYMIEGEGPVTLEKRIPANSRKTYNMAEDIGPKDASIKVESTNEVPVIPERAMYRNNRREGHDSIGTTSPAREYFLAEGAVGYASNFITYVLVQNPNDTPANVDITYLTPSGAIAHPGGTITMPANSRKTVRLNDFLPPNTDVSTKVVGDKPIIAERAMYWNGGPDMAEVCHDSVGMRESCTTFFLPDGETSRGRETWTLIQNSNSTEVDVEISYLTPTGEGNVVKREKIPANSRKTFNMIEHAGIAGRAAIVVNSLDPEKKIMVERAMYWNSRGAGTDTIGGFLNY